MVERAGAGAEGQKDSDGSRSRQDNRERLSQSEVRELREKVESLERRLGLLFVGVWIVFALLLLLAIDVLTKGGV